jgi:hypothetical protein
MATNTYVALQTVTVLSPTTSVNFNLSGVTGYTDLVLVIANGSTNNPTNHTYQFNGDGGTGSLYSTTWLTGNGSAAVSNRHSNDTSILPDYNGYMNSTSNVNTISHFMNYSNNTTYKTVLSRSNNAAIGTDATVGLWRNTNAITSIQVISGSINTFNTGVTLSIYGIKAA